MSIETLGESLLSQAKSKRKKQEKRAKLFTGVMLGVQVGNQVLRRRAEKRANEFWKSNEGVLNQRASQFEKGVGFWDNHNTLMKSKGIAGGGNWKDAYKEELYKTYIDRDLGGTKPKDMIKFKQNVDSKIQDDLKAYEQKLEVYKNFKNIPSTGRTASKTAYVKTLRDKLEKSASTISKRDSIGGYLLSQVGINKKPDMQTTTMLDGESIVTAGGLSSEERKQLMTEFKQSNLLEKNVSLSESSSKYQPMSEEEIKSFMPEGTTSVKPISSHASSLNKAISEDNIRRQESLLNEYRYTYDGKEEQTVRQIYENIAKNDSQQAATIFSNDVLTISRDLQIAYEADPDTTDVKDAEYFVDLAIKEVLPKPRNEGSSFNLESEISIVNPQGITDTKKAGAIVKTFEGLTKEKALDQLKFYKNNFETAYPDLVDYLETFVNDTYANEEDNIPSIFSKNPGVRGGLTGNLPYGAG